MTCTCTHKNGEWALCALHEQAVRDRVEQVLVVQRLLHPQEAGYWVHELVSANSADGTRVLCDEFGRPRIYCRTVQVSTSLSDVVTLDVHGYLITNPEAHVRPRRRS